MALLHQVPGMRRLSFSLGIRTGPPKSAVVGSWTKRFCEADDKQCFNKAAFQPGTSPAAE